MSLLFDHPWLAILCAVVAAIVGGGIVGYLAELIGRE